MIMTTRQRHERTDRTDSYRQRPTEARVIGHIDQTVTLRMMEPDHHATGVRR